MKEDKNQFQLHDFFVHIGKNRLSMTTKQREATIFFLLKGRRGLGSIYVWASGNGGSSGDCCSADSLVSSPYSVAIAALTHESKPAYFQETCPGILTSVYSGGVSKLQMKNLKEGAKMEKSHPMVSRQYAVFY